MRTAKSAILFIERYELRFLDFRSNLPYKITFATVEFPYIYLCSKLFHRCKYVTTPFRIIKIWLICTSETEIE